MIYYTKMNIHTLKIFGKINDPHGQIDNLSINLFLDGDLWSEYNEWFEIHKHEEDEDFEIQHTINTYGKIGLEEIKYGKED